MNIKLAGVAVTVLAVTAGACGGDGPNIWNLASSGGVDTGGGGTSGACQAVLTCCDEMTVTSAQRDICREGATDEQECEYRLGIYQGNGSCTDVSIPGSTPDAGAAGSADGSSGGFGGGISNVPGYACWRPAKNECEIVRSDSQAAADCSEVMGEPVGDTCPTTNLLGCCLPTASNTGWTETCYYSGGDASEGTVDVRETCTGNDAAYSATP